MSFGGRSLPDPLRVLKTSARPEPWLGPKVGIKDGVAKWDWRGRRERRRGEEVEEGEAAHA